jgi:hypothetical protein
VIQLDEESSRAVALLLDASSCHALLHRLDSSEQEEGTLNGEAMTELVKVLQHEGWMTLRSGEAAQKEEIV